MFLTILMVHIFKVEETSQNGCYGALMTGAVHPTYLGDSWFLV